ncbi:permease [Gudongella sp. DL1XJH-153]|uniref:permease n=1 Tax=Gudongella sp. DL1XJH-153 TaxID=3409804 RepID=UPI003BB70A60
MKKIDRNYIYFGVFLMLAFVSFLSEFDLGIRVWNNFLVFAKDMVLILPPAFVLIGLFDVWAKRESVEKHFGDNNNPLRFLWSVLLASTTVGGTFVAFPLANSMYHKGAKYSSIITYITAASLFMIPMSIMEASMLGIKFTIIRLIGSLPFIIAGAILLEKYFEKSGYQLPVVLDDK